jgi:hypothetical protein
VISLTFALDDVGGIENWGVGYRLPFPNFFPAILKVLVCISFRTMKKVRHSLVLNGISVIPLIPMIDGLSLFPKKCIEIFKDIPMF